VRWGKLLGGDRIVIGHVRLGTAGPVIEFHVESHPELLKVERRLLRLDLELNGNCLT